MSWSPISLAPIQYQNPDNNNPYSGAVLKAYAKGTTNNIVMATDSSGATTLSSVELNSSGYPEHLGATVIPHIDRSYKLALFANQAAADADTPAIWSVDDLFPLTTTGSFTVEDAVSNAVTSVITATHETTGTPVAGIGTGQSFSTETANDNIEVGMIIESVSTDVTATSEDFDRVTKLMDAGSDAAERDRLTSDGVYTTHGSIQLNKGADVASGTALPVLTDGNYFDVTGTTTITSINTTKIGNVIRLHFDGILILTHSADLFLPTAANITTAAGDEAEFVEYAAGDYRCTRYTRATGSALAGLLNVVEDTTPQLGGPLSTNSHQVQWSKGADVASAAELAILTDGNYFDVTGTVTITSFADIPVGTVVKLHFDAILTLTNNADIICLSAANVTTAAGDEAEFVYFDTGKVRMTSYSKADGTGLVSVGGITLGTAVATTSGASHYFTGIPSGTKRLSINLDQVSLSSVANIDVYLGDSGGIESSGYSATGTIFSSTPLSTGATDNFPILVSNATATISGTMILTLVDSSTNTWSAFGVFNSRLGVAMTYTVAGTKSLSSELTQFGIEPSSAGVFDGGKVNITYE